MLNNGCNDFLFGVHCVEEGDRIPPLQSYGQALKQKDCFSGVSGYYYYYFLPTVSIPEGGLKIDENKLKGYDAQSVQSGTVRLSCSRTPAPKLTDTND